jgi:hypothetical protein
MNKWVAKLALKGIEMLKFRWFYVLLLFNFLTSISLVVFVYINRENQNMAYYVLPMYIGWIFLMFCSLIPLLMLSIGHLKRAIGFYKANDADGLRRGMKQMKLASIPYFVVNFIYFAALALLAMVASRGIVLFTPIPLIFVLVMLFTYVIMSFTSIYGIVYLIWLKKSGETKLATMVVHIVMQLVFVLDILNTVFLLSWYPNDGKHGFKRTVITFASVVVILALIGGLGWRNLTYVKEDRNINNYPSQDADFSKMAYSTMPSLSDFPVNAKLHFENKQYQRGFSYWQSMLLTAAYDEATYTKEKTNLKGKYNFLDESGNYNGGNYAVPLTEFTIGDYDFHIIDPPGDEFDNFPNAIGMIATSDKEKTIAYLYCYDQNLYEMEAGEEMDVMTKYVNEKYGHFWE